MTVDPFEALAEEWAEQKAECERLAKAEDEAGVAGPDFPSNAAGDRLGEIEQRIAVTPTTTILGIATKLRAEVFAEVDYVFTTTEHVIKTALAGAEYLLAQSQEAEADDGSCTGPVQIGISSVDKEKGKPETNAERLAGSVP